jgi:hypothetical protein
MKILVLKRHLLVAAAALVLAPAGVEAQSVYAARGLGFPLEAQDARSQGLGGVAVGLPGAEISWANPAAAVGLLAPGLVFSYQFDNFDAQGPGTTASGTAARFPMMLGAFPAGDRIVLTAGYGSFLDQNWRVEQPDTLLVFGDTVPVLDIAHSVGGVARLRLGGAYQIAEGVGVGLGLDVYSGSVERLEGRLFPGEFTPGCCRAGWNYRGLGVTGGVHWSPTGDTGLGVSISHGGTLEATPRAGLGTDVGGVVPIARSISYNLPLTARVGGSGRLGQDLLVAVSGNYAGWSALDDDLGAQGGAQDAWTVQGGLEWDGLTIRERPVPIRFGARNSALPFRWNPDAAAGWPTERALTMGAGVVLAGGATRSDFGLEFGNRGGEGAGIEESYWRFAFSVRVLGR